MAAHLIKAGPAEIENLSLSGATLGPMPAMAYIMASKKGRTLYTGVTNYPARRIYEHREGLVAGFTLKYGVKILV